MRDVDSSNQDSVLKAAQVEDIQVEPKVGQSFSMPDITVKQFAKRNYAVRLTICGSNWGSSFLAVTAMAAAIYIIGGVAMGYSIGRRGGGGGGVLSAHPHFPMWKEIPNLCGEGVTYSRARLMREPGGSLEPSFVRTFDSENSSENHRSHRSHKSHKKPQKHSATHR